MIENSIVENSKDKQIISGQELESSWNNYVLLFDKENIQKENESWKKGSIFLTIDII